MVPIHYSYLFQCLLYIAYNKCNNVIYCNNIVKQRRTVLDQYNTVQLWPLIFLTKIIQEIQLEPVETATDRAAVCDELVVKTS